MLWVDDSRVLMVWDLRPPREAGGQVTLCAEVAMVARGLGKTWGLEKVV